MKKLESLSLDKFENERLSRQEIGSVFGGLRTKSGNQYCTDTITNEDSKKDGSYPAGDWMKDCCEQVAGPM